MRTFEDVIGHDRVRSGVQLTAKGIFEEAYQVLRERRWCYEGDWKVDAIDVIVSDDIFDELCGVLSEHLITIEFGSEHGVPPGPRLRPQAIAMDGEVILHLWRGNSYLSRAVAMIWFYDWETVPTTYVLFPKCHLVMLDCAPQTDFQI